MKIWHRITACLVLASLVLQSLTMVTSAKVPVNLYLSQVQSLALANNDAFTRKYNEILLEQVKYEDAVRSVTEKQRNMSTFRWSFLLSFEFPEKANLTESMEFLFKPLTIQNNITTLTQEMLDLKYEVIATVSQLYMDCYILQEQVAFNQEMLASAEEDLERATFLAKSQPEYEAEQERLDARVSTLTSEVALQLRNFENAKTALSQEMEIDYSTGYTFRNCLEELSIDRDDVTRLVNHTLANSQEYFETQVASYAAQLNMDLAEQKMTSAYGGYMNMITPYLSQVRRGVDVDAAAFQLAYRSFLTAIDARWQGYYKIFWFIKISKELMKGDLDGIRYVEDEPYYLYTAAMDYSTARDTQESTATTISTSVKLEFENIITAHNAYTSAVELTEDMADQLEQLVMLNRMGEVDGDEVNAKQEEYQTQQLDTLGMLSDYNEMLIAYDRLTVGGITALLTGASLDGDSGSGGDMLGTSISNDEPYYYITSRVQDMLVQVGVNIPDEFEITVTDYELWYNDTQIGTRTAIDSPILHLAIAAENDENMLDIRFYNEDEFVQTCAIDAMLPKGPLDFNIVEAEEKVEEKVVGTFTTDYNVVLDTMTIAITPEDGLGIASYRITDSQGNWIYSETPLSTDTSLVYLQLMAEDMSTLVVELYDDGGTLLYSGRLNASAMDILAIVEGE
ncbi:MAG: hypothetical protein R3Y62_00645 [Eubacteriales bacterium]